VSMRKVFMTVPQISKGWGTTLALPLHEEPLRVVDRELQHAYERGASEQELQQLWQRRQAIARSGSASVVPQPFEI